MIFNTAKKLRRYTLTNAYASLPATPVRNAHTKSLGNACMKSSHRLSIAVIPRWVSSETCCCCCCDGLLRCVFRERFQENCTNSRPWTWDLLPPPVSCIIIANIESRKKLQWQLRRLSGRHAALETARVPSLTCRCVVRITVSKRNYYTHEYSWLRATEFHKSNKFRFAVLKYIIQHSNKILQFDIVASNYLQNWRWQPLREPIISIFDKYLQIRREVFRTMITIEMEIERNRRECCIPLTHYYQNVKEASKITH